ncbi:MAG TPA: SigB/SigF/SigG family RNA polymerase sigma factor [Armatimonadota bacterium]|jgi:RNA polymerase sigma-B factor
MIQSEVAELFQRYFDTRDAALRDQLVLMHKDLARLLAGKFKNRGQPLEDLIGVATIGLINAIDRYDPSRGTKFSTYATPTILGEMKRYFRDKSWHLKVPRHLQELNWAANRAAERLTQELSRKPTIPEIAEEIGATEEETLEAIELVNAHETVSLDNKLTLEEDTVPLTQGDVIGGPDLNLQRIDSFEDLRSAIDSLEPRERSIIKLRFFSDLSQTEVAKRLDISQMHVSRLQTKALKKLKQLLSSSS